MDSSEIAEATAVEVADHGDDHDHPSDNKYMQIAAILAVLTALEVATYFVNMPGAVLVPALMVMMVVKFFLVAAWFMHLRFDSRMFTRFFVTGLVLATTVYLITLTGFHGVHVSVGIVMLMSLYVSSLRGNLRRESAETVEIVGLYWHFVDVVWILIFTVIYLVPSPTS